MVIVRIISFYEMQGILLAISIVYSLHDFILVMFIVHRVEMHIENIHI
jgi:hypothetical protein